MLLAPPQSHTGFFLENPIIDILTRTNQFLVINKPAGLPVHPGRAGGGSVEDQFPAWRVGKNGPWLAHRLDQDTAGCLVIALKKSALMAAQAAFAGGLAQKEYWALVQGAVAAEAGTVNQPLAKQTLARAWKMVPDSSAPPAITDWAVGGRGVGFTWLKLYPRTGRTHQIRAHCAFMGHPIRGDAVYGGGAGALMLLARAITLPLDPALSAVAPPPPHIAEKLAALLP